MLLLLPQDPGLLQPSPIDLLLVFTPTANSVRSYLTNARVKNNVIVFYYSLLQLANTLY